MQPNTKKHLLTAEETERLLAHQEVGHLATVNPEGHPYVTPVHYVYLDGKVYIHGMDAGQKVENLKRNPLVGFEIQKCGDFKISPEAKTACNVNTEYESVVITGRASFLENAARKEAVLWAIVCKYVPSLEKLPMPAASIAGTCVIEIDIESMTGKYYRQP
ncbi:MAG: pyridoxamine 5'-phosphate oxidase family protein [Eubacteriales bacterium]|jgi:nitroimidazol reductase NimA-like FMN-containing flavoprotein (pyridoxamine 5'-phosphate oxidase superfamily)|nr:pyridoxamine 5'-phosphate oxidase family protein [Eubacteriales bacterium]